jgi:hypothetical protein
VSDHEAGRPSGAAARRRLATRLTWRPGDLVPLDRPGDQAAARTLRWALDKGAAFLLRVRVRGAPALKAGERGKWNPRNDAALLIARDLDLSLRYANRFGAAPALLAEKLYERGEEIVQAAHRAWSLARVAALVRKAQADALARGLVSMNLAASRQAARAGFRPYPRRPPAPRGRPADAALLRRLIGLGLSRHEAEDLLFLAALRLPPTPTLTPSA